MPRHYQKLADGPVSRILCGVHLFRRLKPTPLLRAAAIIPLGHASRRDSSSLPEGSPLRQLALPRRERVRFREFARRAGPALPSYLALHHAGFSMPPMLPSERWALTPPFHPCQTLRACRRRALARLLSRASRRFPCAMPPRFTPPAVYSLWHFP